MHRGCHLDTSWLSLGSFTFSILSSPVDANVEREMREGGREGEGTRGKESRDEIGCDGGRWGG